MIDTVDNYLIDGCMRCDLGGTPDCKVHKWQEELKLLRSIVLDCGLNEEVKWGVPCYNHEGANVLIVSAFVDFCSINFFKGVLLEDPSNLLVKPGPNSQSGRLMKFTDAKYISEIEDILRSYIYEAIEIEKAGLKVEFKKNPEPIPEELEQKCEEDMVFKTAFESLTPGRQRGYILFFSAPKQSKTRVTRIEKSVENILNGLGMHDNYKRNMKSKLVD